MIIKNIKKIIPILLLGFLTLQVTGQDWHWSQFYASPLTLNPAMTGFYDGGCRASGNFREQWGGVYSTYQASYEHRFHNNIVKNELFDAGLVVFQDNQGSNNSFSNLRIELALAYTKELNESHSITFAVQPSFGQLSFQLPENAVFSDDLAYYNNSPVIRVPEVPGEKNNQFDVATGLLWSGQVTEKMSLYSGVGIFHLLSPSNDFIQGDTIDKIKMKIAFHGGGRMALNEKISALPNFVYLNQGGNSELNLGATFEYKLPETSPLKYASAGFHFRNDDAAIVLLGMGYKAFNLGLSYDLTFTSLSAVQEHRNALELSLNYICPIKELKIIRAKPCPRF